MKTGSLKWVFVGGLLVAIALASFVSPGDSPTAAAAAPVAGATPPAAASSKNPERDAQLQAAAMGAVALKKSSKDPDSFEMKSVIVKPTGAACYEYRAKNSFNAMLAGSAILTPKKKMLVHERDGNAFVKAWNSECTKDGGDEILATLKRLELM